MLPVPDCSDVLSAARHVEGGRVERIGSCHTNDSSVTKAGSATWAAAILIASCQVRAGCDAKEALG